MLNVICKWFPYNLFLFEMKPKPLIVILGGARDYHAMDWYRAVRQAAPDRAVKLLTDMIGGEGYPVLIKPDDNIDHLFIIDKLLFAQPSRLGDIWRNVLKLLMLPMQIMYLRRFSSKNPDCIYHAHPMYYMLLAWLSGIDYIGTPQGSEVLVRPYRSKLYKIFSRKLLRMARLVTVDSAQMASKISDMAGVKPMIVQNGIDLDLILQHDLPPHRNTKVASIRGMAELYRIREIVNARDAGSCQPSISFIYPFHDEEYLKSIRSKLSENDKLIGRLNKRDMYCFLSKVELVLSVPKSDSSPRSVYEAIFLGCIVASPYNSWMDALPECMAKRIIIIDLNDAAWFDKALEKSTYISKNKFIPTEDAINSFDQTRIMARLVNKIYL